MVEGFVKSILRSEKKGNYSVLIPSSDKKCIYVNFQSNQLPKVELDIPEIQGQKLFETVKFKK